MRNIEEISEEDEDGTVFNSLLGLSNVTRRETDEKGNIIIDAIFLGEWVARQVEDKYGNVHYYKRKLK